MPNLKLTNDEVLRALGLVMGVNRDPAEWDTQTKEDARAMIRAGLRDFHNPGNHEWRFLERSLAIAATPSYSTGTVTVASGTVTLADGTWPTWAADGILRVDGQTAYVTARTSGTVLTINHDGIAAAAGTTYELIRWREGLPADFGEFIGGVVYSTANQAHLLRGVDNDNEIRLRYAANFRTGGTQVYSIVAGSDADASAWYFTFWPTMDEGALVTATYRASPEDKLDADDLLVGPDIVQVGQTHAGTALAAILAAAEMYYMGAPGIHTEKFQMLMAQSIEKDRRTPGPISSMDPRIDARRYSLLYHVPTYHDLL